MYIDFAALKRDIDIKEVLELFGIDPRKSFTCVSKEHNDKSPSMSVNKKNNTCHCFSCNATFNPLSLVMEETGLSVFDAGKYLINTFNLDKSIYTTPSIYEDMETDPFPFTRDEIKAMGLEMNYSFSSIKATDSDVFFKIEREVKADIDDDFTEEMAHEEIIRREQNALRRFKRDVRISMPQMYKEDKEGFYFVAESSIYNAIDKLETARENLNNIFKKEKSEYYKVGTKETRNSVVNNYLGLMSDPIGYDLVEAEKLLEPESKAILDKYLPLRDTHAYIKEIDARIDYLASLLEKIPNMYRTHSLDSILEQSYENVKTEPEKQTHTEEIER